MTSHTAALDTCYSIETPEGIHLQLHIAGVFVRGVAWLIDLLWRGLLYMLAGVMVSLFSLIGLEQSLAGLFLILAFLLEWFFPVYFEIYHQGQTPGKKSMGLMVIKEDGAPVDWGGSLTRNLLRIVDMLPLAYFFGFLACLYSPRFQRLGDMAAGTLVVYRHKVPSKKTKPAEAPIDQEVLAPPCPLSATEQRLIMDYTRRSPQLSPARQAELADLLPTHFTQTKGAQGFNPHHDAAQQVQSYGRWLMGGKP